MFFRRELIQFVRGQAAESWIKRLLFRATASILVSIPIAGMLQDGN